MLGGRALLAALGSPMGRAFMVVAAFLAWTAYQRHDAANTALAAFRAEIEAETAAAKQAQVEAARRLAEAARIRADEADARAAELEAERDEIVEMLRERPLGDCDIPDDVRERLRAIGS